MSIQSLPQTDTYHTRVIVSAYQDQDCLQNQPGYNPDRHGSCSGTPMAAELVTRLQSAISDIQREHKFLNDPVFQPDFVWLEFCKRLNGSQQGEVLRRLTGCLASFGLHIHASFSVTG